MSIHRRRRRRRRRHDSGRHIAESRRQKCIGVHNLDRTANSARARSPKPRPKHSSKQKLSFRLQSTKVFACLWLVV